MKMKRKLLLPVFAIAFVGSTFGLSKVQAQIQENKYPLIVERLAQRFGLKESDVQAVFEEVHQERQQEMQARLEERLTQAVKNGKITESQKQAILAKHKELTEKRQQNKENWRNMTLEEKRKAIQQQRQELKSWADQNGIDLKYLFGWFGAGRVRWWFK